MRVLSIYQKNCEEENQYVAYRVLINFVLTVMKDTTHIHTE